MNFFRNCSRQIFFKQTQSIQNIFIFYSIRLKKTFIRNAECFCNGFDDELDADFEAEMEDDGE
ncbi:MAG: hypothetical protein ACTTKX_05740 [Treponema sp.]